VKPLYTFAQISDSHLYASKDHKHHGANVYQNLLAVLSDIKNNPEIDAIVFTGDLTHDHTSASYDLFVEATEQARISVPVYYLAGNHDEPALLASAFACAPFVAEKLIELPNWQLVLVDSKSDTPAGRVSPETLLWLADAVDKSKSQLVMMHHHGIDVGYFIDRHGLENKEQFWQVIKDQPSIKAVACGHVHRALTLLPEETGRSTPLFTCPATSIQFDPRADTVASTGEAGGYRVFQLLAEGKINTHVRYTELIR